MSSSIARWHRACAERFETLCDACKDEEGQHEEEEQEHYRLFFDEHGRFNVWAGNIGAHQSGRVSLDFRLRDAGHIRDQVVSLLQYLSEILEEGKHNHSISYSSRLLIRLKRPLSSKGRNCPIQTPSRRTMTTFPSLRVHPTRTCNDLGRACPEMSPIYTNYRS